MREWHRNRVANVMDADKKSIDSFLFSDEVIDNFFSAIQGGLERECGEKTEGSSSSTDSEQSVSLNDEELWKFLEEQRNSNTQKKTLSDLTTWYHWCKGINEKRKIENILPKN